MNKIFLITLFATVLVFGSVKEQMLIPVSSGVVNYKFENDKGCQALENLEVQGAGLPSVWKKFLYSGSNIQNFTISEYYGLVELSLDKNTIVNTLTISGESTTYFYYRLKANTTATGVLNLSLQLINGSNSVVNSANGVGKYSDPIPQSPLVQRTINLAGQSVYIERLLPLASEVARLSIGGTNFMSSTSSVLLTGTHASEFGISLNENTGFQAGNIPLEVNTSVGVFYLKLMGSTPSASILSASIMVTNGTISGTFNGLTGKVFANGIIVNSGAAKVNSTDVNGYRVQYALNENPITNANGTFTTASFTITTVGTNVESRNVLINGGDFKLSTLSGAGLDQFTTEIVVPATFVLPIYIALPQGSYDFVSGAEKSIAFMFNQFGVYNDYFPRMAVKSTLAGQNIQLQSQNASSNPLTINYFNQTSGNILVSVAGINIYEPIKVYAGFDILGNIYPIKDYDSEFVKFSTVEGLSDYTTLPGTGGIVTIVGNTTFSNPAIKVDLLLVAHPISVSNPKATVTTPLYYRFDDIPTISLLGLGFNSENEYYDVELSVSPKRFTVVGSNLKSPITLSGLNTGISGITVQISESENTGYTAQKIVLSGGASISREVFVKFTGAGISDRFDREYINNFFSTQGNEEPFSNLLYFSGFYIASGSPYLEIENKPKFYSNIGSDAFPILTPDLAPKKLDLITAGITSGISVSGSDFLRFATSTALGTVFTKDLFVADASSPIYVSVVDTMIGKYCQSLTIKSGSKSISVDVEFEVLVPGITTFSGVDTTLAGVNRFDESTFSVFPNPSKGQFSFETNVEIESEQIQVFNTYGQSVAFRYSQKILFIDTKGIYILLLGNKKIKLIVE